MGFFKRWVHKKDTTLEGRKATAHRRAALAVETARGPTTDHERERMARRAARSAFYPDEEGDFLEGALTGVLKMLDDATSEADLAYHTITVANIREEIEQYANGERLGS